MSVASRLATGPGSPEFDTTGLCLLSLDGGGVRGLSTLYVLQNIMRRVNHDRIGRGDSYVKPCEAFDLIGGTSTGGLIAIMLGRLEMDVDECIEAYSELMEEVFHTKLHKLQVTATGSSQPRFDSGKLKDAIERVIEKKGEKRDALLNDQIERGCRVFVCTASKRPYDMTRLRSYDLVDGPKSIRATICQAALATSAATGFFEAVRIGNSEFVDGALGQNNPVDIVEREATDIWSTDAGEIQPLVKCFISIGTGKPDTTAIEDWLPTFLTETLVKIVTETEKTAATFIARWRGPFDGRRYFRFNVEQGLQKIGLEEHKKKGEIERATQMYLDDQVQRFLVRDCAKNLSQKKHKTDTSFEEFIKQQNPSFNDKDLLCLQQLVVVSPKDHKEMIKHQKGGLLDDAYKWVLQSDEFVAFETWQSKESSPQICQMLWIKGHAGTGKTMLLIGLVHELEVRGSISEPSLCYFFCQAADSRLNNVTAVLRSLIWLLILQQKHLIRHLRQKYDIHGPKMFDENGIAFYTLRTILKNILMDPALLPVYFVVDALDECENGDPGARGFLEIIKESLSISEKVKWLVSSRLEIQHDTSGDSISVIELNALNLERPVSAYIKHKLGLLREKEGYTNAVMEELSREFYERARNTFLWVALVFLDLDFNETPGGRAIDKIKEIPPELGALYEHMMARIEKRSRVDTRDCKKTLMAVLLAYRPLTVEELFALAALPSNSNVQTVVRECRSFLTVTEDGKIQLIHQSAKDYLESCYTSHLGVGGVAHDHFYLYQRCIHALSASEQSYKALARFDMVPEGRLALIKDHSKPLQYYCRYWVLHYCESRSSRCGGDEDVLRFLKTHFIHWVQCLYLLKLFSEPVQSIRKLLNVLQESSTLHSGLVGFLKDAKRFLQSCVGVVTEDPVQLYGSALIFSPRSSEVKQALWGQRLPFLKTIKGEKKHWDLCLQTLEGHANVVTSVAFSPDGQQLASSSQDGKVRLWSTDTGTIQHVLDGHRDSVRSVTFSPNSKSLVSTSNDGQIYVWDAKNGNLCQTLEKHKDKVVASAFSPDGERLATASYNGDLLLWDTNGYKYLKNLKHLGKHSRHVTAVTFAPDGTKLVSSSHDKPQMRVSLWNLPEISHQYLGKHDRFVTTVAFSIDSKLLATGSEDGGISLWIPSTGTLLRTMAGSGKPITSVAFSPTNNTLAAASKDMTVWLWDDPYTSYVRLWGHRALVTSLAFSPDGTMIASASHDKTIRLWDMPSKAHDNPLEHLEYRISAVALSENVCKLASATRDGTIQVFTIASDTPQTFPVHKDRVYALEFSKDGKKIVSASTDGTVRYLDLATGANRRVFSTKYGSIKVVAFSPDGSRFAAASKTEILICETDTGNCKDRIVINKECSKLGFSEDGNWLISDYGRHTSKWLSAPAWRQREQGCRRSRLSISNDWIVLDRRRLLWLPADYRPTCIAAQNETLVMGHESGSITILQFDLEYF